MPKYRLPLRRGELRKLINSTDECSVPYESLERVARWEEEHGFTSAQLLAGLKDGSIYETATIAQWLFEIKILETVYGQRFYSSMDN